MQPSSASDSDFHEAKPRYAFINKRACFVLNKVLSYDYTSLGARRYANRRLVMLEGRDESEDGEWHESEESDAEYAERVCFESILKTGDVRAAREARRDAPPVPVTVINLTWMSTGKGCVERLNKPMIRLNGFYDDGGDAYSRNGCDAFIVVTPAILDFLRATHRQCRHLDRLSVRRPGRTPMKPTAVEPPVQARALMRAQEVIFEHRESFTEWEYVTACNALKRAFDAAL